MKVLSITYGGSHANLALKMAQEFEKRGISNIIIAMPGAIPMLKKSGVPFKTLNDYAFLFDNRDEILDLGYKLAKTYHNPEVDIDIEDTAAYFGFCMTDLTSEHGRQNAEKLFSEKERKCFWPVNTLKRIFEFEKPDFIQTTSSVRAEGAAADAGRKLGITTYRIQDTINAKIKLETDYLFTINQSQYEEAIKKGGDEKRIIISGQPAFEKYSGYDKKKCREEINAIFSLNDNPVIVWLPVGIIDEQEILTYKKICETAKKNKDWNFIIKLHPTSHKENEFIKYDSEPEIDNIYRIKHMDIAVLLKAADMAITTFSTSGFETLLLDTNLIVTNIYNKQYNPDYTKGGAAVKLSDLSELPPLINDMLYNEELNNELSEARKKVRSSSKASENIINFLTNIKREKAN